MVARRLHLIVVGSLAMWVPMAEARDLRRPADAVTARSEAQDAEAKPAGCVRIEVDRAGDHDFRDCSADPI
jgi:hypothetical protein